MGDETNLAVNLSYAGGTLGDQGAETNLFLFVLWGIILPMVAAMGLVGNVLTIVVLWRREMQSTTILYLRALVITDTGLLIAGVICLTPLSCANYLGGEALGHFKDSIYPILYAPGYYSVMSLQQANVFITVAVSMERYVAICHPFRAARLITRRRTIVLLTVICVTSFIYNIPHLFATYAKECEKNTHTSSTHSSFDISSSGNNNNNNNNFNNYNNTNYNNTNNNHANISSLVTSTLQSSTVITGPPENNSTTIASILNVSRNVEKTTQTRCSDLIVTETEFGRSGIYSAFRTGLYGAIIYCIPFLALLILNSFLVKELMVMQRRRSGTNINDENEANLSLVLVLIVVVFIICQTPGLVSQFDIIPSDVYPTWLGVANLMLCTNSAVNFLIYTTFGRKFRKVLLRVIRHFYGGNHKSSTSSYRGWNFTTNNDYEMSTAADIQNIIERPDESTVLYNTPVKQPKTNGHAAPEERKPLCESGSSSQDSSHKAEEEINGETNKFNEE